MKEGWEIKKLIDVVDFQRGLTYSKKDEVDFSKNMVLRSNNIDLKTNKLDFTEIRYINPKIVIPENKKVTKGSLIICTANGSKSHLGKVALIDDNYNFAFGGFMGLIKPKENLNSDFLFHLLTSEAYKKFIGALSDGANINNLKFSDLGEFEIPIPPLPEQHRIVAILDEAFTAISIAKANAERNLKNAKDLFESYLQGVFENKGEDWEGKTLGEIAFVKSGGTPSRSKKEYWVGDIAWYSSGELNNLYTQNPERNINELAINNSNAKLFPKGSLLIGMYDTAALKMSILDRDGTFNQAIAGVKPNEKIDLIFILHSINSIKPDLLNLRRGVRQKNLSLEKIKSIPIFLPALKTQKKIVNKLDVLSSEIKKLESIYKQKLEDLEELKKSMLQKAFSGEL